MCVYIVVIFRLVLRYSAHTHTHTHIRSVKSPSVGTYVLLSYTTMYENNSTIVYGEKGREAASERDTR